MVGYIFVDCFSALLDHLGRPGQSLWINAGILGHYIGYDSEVDEEDDLISVGIRGQPITVQDLKEALECLGELPFEKGRSYFLDGIYIETREDITTIRLIWGS